MVRAAVNEPGDRRLSIIIPALNEARALPLLLEDLKRIALPHEIIVADGGSTDGTPALAAKAGARVVTAPRGRGAQMHAGALQSRGEILCFLHADVRMPAAAIGAMSAAVSGPMGTIHAFRLRIDAAGLGYRLIEIGANLRSRMLGLPYGDQGLIVRRDLYDRAGGFLALPLMEDVTLVRALARLAPVRLLDAPILVSARRWEREGRASRTIRNWTLILAWLLGASPERLAKWYRPEA